MKAEEMLISNLKCEQLTVFTFYKIWTNKVHKFRKSNLSSFQGHCIGFQGFRRKKQQFQGPQVQLFKIKAFQGFQGPLATLIY